MRGSAFFLLVDLWCSLSLCIAVTTRTCTIKNAPHRPAPPPPPSPTRPHHFSKHFQSLRLIPIGTASSSCTSPRWTTSSPRLTTSDGPLTSSSCARQAKHCSAVILICIRLLWGHVPGGTVRVWIEKIEMHTHLQSGTSTRAPNNLRCTLPPIQSNPIPRFPYIHCEQKKGERCFVHCKAGHGRSAAVALSWYVFNSYKSTRIADLGRRSGCDFGVAACAST